MTLDDVLNEIEKVIDFHPTPVERAHCEHCSAWLLIVEDILGNN